MAVRTLIAEDEKPARRRLRSMLEGIPELVVVGEAENGQMASKLIDRLRPDLVLLDIQMPKQNGFEVLAAIHHIPEIVFVTAYDQYAIRAFEVDAVDYLLKPYTRHRLLKAIEKAIRLLHETSDQRARILSLLERYRQSESRLTRITVRTDDDYRVFEVHRIALFRAEDGLVFLHVGDERFLLDLSLQSLEDRLDPEEFMRVHRNAIVNLKMITRIRPDANGKLLVELQGGQTVVVSRYRAQQLKSITGFVRGGSCR